MVLDCNITSRLYNIVQKRILYRRHLSVYCANCLCDSIRIRSRFVGSYPNTLVFATGSPDFGSVKRETFQIKDIRVIKSSSRKHFNKRGPTCIGAAVHGGLLPSIPQKFIFHQCIALHTRSLMKHGLLTLFSFFIRKEFILNNNFPTINKKND